MNCLVTFSAAALLQIGVLLSQTEVDDKTFVGYSPGFTISGTGKKVSSASALESAAKSGGKITVSGNISNALIICGSNTHIEGDGTAELSKVSFLIKNASNVTIQNLTMHLPYTGSVSGSDHDNDVIHVEGSGAKNIWIDHCDLSNEFDGVGKDDYDGLIDTKKGASNITISWNYIHDAWKTNLNGHSDKDKEGKWNISMHHNIFNKVGSRIPSIRGGKAAVFNNYYLNVPNTCINSRLGAEVYCEKNYFDGVGTGKPDKPLQLGEGPIGTWYSAEPGKYNSVDNYYIRCKGNQPANSESTTSYKPSFMSGNKTVIPAMDVPEVLMEKAGVRGKFKKLAYPEGHNARIFRATQSYIHNPNPAASALYNLSGVKIVNGRDAHNTLANGVFIANENGKSVIRLNAMR